MILLLVTRPAGIIYLNLSLNKHVTMAILRIKMAVTPFAKFKDSIFAQMYLFKIIKIDLLVLSHAAMESIKNKHYNFVMMEI